MFWSSVNSDLTQRKSLFVQNNSLTPDTSLHPHILFLVTVLLSQQSSVSLKPSHIYITQTMAAVWFIFKSFWWVNRMEGCNLRKPDMCRKETFKCIPFQHENIQDFWTWWHFWMDFCILRDLSKSYLQETLCTERAVLKYSTKVSYNWIVNIHHLI